MKTQKITPCLWVDKDAKKAARYYLSVFKNGKLKSHQAYKNIPSPSGDFDTATINLLGMDFQILAAGPLFKFNEAVSFVIRCKDQAEIDYYWKALTARGGSEGPCGWLKDKYGLSWQVVPELYFKLESHKNKAKRQYAFNAVMKMKKIIIADLEEKKSRPK
jgi:predicted 3-demethylubiquinone-9 3-methyltransferase (glyoxalase superfamily)